MACLTEFEDTGLNKNKKGALNVATKRIFVWMLGIATLVLVLYVRNEYNKINGVGPAAPAKPSASATPPPKDKPAPVTDATGEGAFMGLPFGADEKAIVARFRGQLKKLEARQEFAFSYVDYILPGFDMDGVAMDVYFQMDKDTQVLTQVMLRNMAENKPPGVFAEAFKSLFLSRTIVYGMPESTEEGERGSSFFAEKCKWTQGRTSIYLSRTQKAYANGETSEMLTLRFTQTG